jgi:hypothetical protein
VLRPLLVGLVGAALGAAIVGITAERRVGHVVAGQAYVRSFDDSTGALDLALAVGDGQSYAAIARDPALDHPGRFRGGAREEAYRGQRPLASYLVWAGTAGRPGLVPLGLAAATVAGAGLASGAAAVLLERRRARPWWALALLVAPPSLVALSWLTPELLALGLGLAGLLLWRGPRRRPALAAVLLAAAVLTRETMLVMVLAMAVAEAWHRPRRRLRRLAPLALPVAALVGWAAVVRARLGWWPWSAAQRRLGAPIRGLAGAVPTWRGGASWAALAAAVVLAVACVATRPRTMETAIVIAYAAFALVMGSNVWLRWQDFSRPLLPLYALAILAIVPSTSAAPSTASQRAMGATRKPQ